MEPGERLGAYEILSELGSGGMGVVYRARDTSLGRDVAIKILSETGIDDEDRMARFEREAKLLAALNHPGIATLYGFETDGGTRFLVMELVAGETLAERIARGRMSAETALTLFARIADALDAAHEKGIIHRDLKPANVKITPGGEPKLLDFGLAKALGGEALGEAASESPTAMRDTAHGVVLGTAHYMSPEQARGESVDKRTDVWAFGCSLYEALSSRKAFGGPTMAETMASILEHDPDWTALPSNTPPSLVVLLRRCLAKNQRDRLRDIGDARLTIDECVAGAARTERSPSSRSKRRGALLLASSAVAGFLVATAIRTPPRPDDEHDVSRFSIALPEDAELGPFDAPSVALSPDGTAIVFTARSGNRTRLYLRELDQLDSRAIPGTENARGPAFSGDGRTIFFVKESDRRAFSVSLMSGESRILHGEFDGFSAGWEPDGEVVAATRDGIVRLSTEAPEPQVLTSLRSGEALHRNPQLLPGDVLLFGVELASGARRVDAVKLQSGERRTLLKGPVMATFVTPGYLLYPTDDRVLALEFDPDELTVGGEPMVVVDGIRSAAPSGADYAVSRSGSLVYVPGATPANELCWVDRSGRLETVLHPPAGFLQPRLSPDGAQVVVTVRESLADDRTNLWVYSLERDTLSRLSFSEKDTRAIWSQDGRSMFFTSWRAGGYNIFSMPADGSGDAQRVTTSPSFQIPTSSSPDGASLVYTQEGDRGYDIWIVDDESPDAPRPFLVGRFNERLGMVSPNGRWIAYVSDESGRDEVYVRSFPSGAGKSVVSTEGGTQPLWSRNGKELFFRHGEEMLAVSVTGEESFAASRPSVLFTGDYDYGFRTGADHSTNFDISPDGSRLLMLRERKGLAEIHVVLNLPQVLNRRSSPF